MPMTVASLARWMSRTEKFFRSVSPRRRPAASATVDVVVIGGGCEGSAAAIKAAQVGLKTICIEAQGILGGNLPHKAVLSFHEARCARRRALVDLCALAAERDKATACLTKGIEGIFRKDGVNYITGFARFISPSEVSIDTLEGEVTVRGKRIIIATGSCFKPSWYATVDEEKIVSSTRALSLSEVPERAIVIGASYIGLEVGSVWAQLGSEVTVIDPASVIIPSMDGEIRKKFQSMLVERQKLKFMLEREVVKVDVSSSSGVELTIQPTSGGLQSMIKTDVVLAPECRVPNTAGLGLEMIGINTDVNTGEIKIDKQFTTSIPHIYAIGDVATPRPMLDAHKAATDGIECMKIMAGKGHVLPDLDKVPGVIYTPSEVASIGMTEEQAKARGVRYQVFKSSMDEAEGTVKLLVSKETKKVVGVHLLSPIAGSKIGVAAEALKYKDRDVPDLVGRLTQRVSMFNLPDGP